MKVPSALYYIYAAPYLWTEVREREQASILVRKQEIESLTQQTIISLNSTNQEVAERTDSFSS